MTLVALMGSCSSSSSSGWHKSMMRLGDRHLTWYKRPGYSKNWLDSLSATQNSAVYGFKRHSIISRLLSNGVLFQATLGTSINYCRTKERGGRKKRKLNERRGQGQKQEKNNHPYIRYRNLHSISKSPPSCTQMCSCDRSRHTFEASLRSDLLSLFPRLSPPPFEKLPSTPPDEVHHQPSP